MARSARKSSSNTTRQNPSNPKGQHAGTGQLRIVGGQWRSRRLPIPTAEGLRPTPDRMGETLFNWLTGWVTEARCLDVFSGSGALGLEALSRGAVSAVFLEQAREPAQQLTANLQSLGCDNAKVINIDALSWLQQKAGQPYQLIFLDPPFRKDMLAPACEALDKNGYTGNSTLIYIESEKELTTLPVPDHWYLWKEKQAGQVISRLYRVDI